MIDFELRCTRGGPLQLCVMPVCSNFYHNYNYKPKLIL